MNQPAKIQLTKNFYLNEFACKDGTPVPDAYLNNVRLLAHYLQIIRNYTKKPMIIVSGFRSYSYNRLVKGAPYSQHLVAGAGDIKSPDIAPYELHTIIEKLIAAGQIKDGGLGLYDTFVHYDVTGKPRRWDFRKKLK